MKRDIHDIIVQPEGLQFSDGTVVDDGGDSAFSTGLMAFTGCERDKRLMPLFIKDGQIVRHPFQNFNTGTHSHDDPKSVSRDQVIAFFAGFDVNDLGNVHNSSDYLMLRKVCLNYAKSWKVNRDVLMPSNKLYLYKRAGVPAPTHIFVLGHLNFAFDLLVTVLISRFIDSEHEVNQSVVMSATYGKLHLSFLKKFHPNLWKTVKNYFCGWRQRCVIAERLEILLGV